VDRSADHSVKRGDLQPWNADSRLDRLIPLHAATSPASSSSKELSGRLPVRSQRWSFSQSSSSCWG
jgi:hypothetical protein